MGVSVADRAAELRDARTPFVHARVVLAERPTSARPGDEAIVRLDGTIEGFVGGACAQATVRDQSLRLLQSGESLLLRVTPDPEPDQPGKLVVHNHCLSGGTIEIFLEPEMPTPLVVVAGDAPIAQALMALGERMGYELHTYEGALPTDASAVVVASHGRDEEAVLIRALEADVGYVGLVASPRRGTAVVDSLDVSDELRQRVDVPAGLDIGARTPEEVACSILAGIIQVRPRPASPVPSVDPPAAAGTATDPVCGMSVAMVATSRHVDHDGRRVWFCGSGCQRAFTADPTSFTVQPQPPAVEHAASDR